MKSLIAVPILDKCSLKWLELNAVAGWGVFKVLSRKYEGSGFEKKLDHF